MLDVCRENNIVVQAYGPVGSGTSNTFVGGAQDGVTTHGNHLIYFNMLNQPVISYYHSKSVLASHIIIICFSIG